MTGEEIAQFSLMAATCFRQIRIDDRTSRKRKRSLNESCIQCAAPLVGQRPTRPTGKLGNVGGVSTIRRKTAVHRFLHAPFGAER